MRSENCPQHVVFYLVETIADSKVMVSPFFATEEQAIEYKALAVKGDLDSEITMHTRYFHSSDEEGIVGLLAQIEYPQQN